jgi:hypothetical protein
MLVCLTELMAGAISRQTQMPDRLTIEAAFAHLERCTRPSLIAIDGLPCSGKSTITNRLAQRLELECVHLDEFVLPENDWPPNIKPPFLSSTSDMRRS